MKKKTQPKDLPPLKEFEELVQRNGVPWGFEYKPRPAPRWRATRKNVLQAGKVAFTWTLILGASIWIWIVAVPALLSLLANMIF